MKNKLPIPKQFELHGQTIRIEFEPSMANDRGCVGESKMKENKLLLQTSVSGHVCSQEYIEQTFCHELVHFILLHMGSDKNGDEVFVDTFGHLLHQALVTAEYGKVK